MHNEITELSFKGEGLAKNISILYALPGESVEVERRGRKRIASKIIQSSSSRVAAFCPHFTRCGGCKLQHMAYPAQIAFKEKMLFELFERVVEVVPSPKTTHFRNRMDYVITPDAVGLREAGSWKHVVDLEACPIFVHEDVFVQHKEALRLLPAYNMFSKEGIFKYAVFRGSAKESLLILCCTSKGKEFSSLLIEKFGDIPNICLAINDSIGDVSMTDETVVLKGKPSYTEKIGTFSFEVPANGFAQPNPSQAVQLYAYVKSLVETDEVVDLFCGVGSIGLFIAPKTLFGVEVVEQSVEYAKRNAQHTGLNAHFSVADLYKNPEIPGDCPTIIVDPPRLGIGPKLIHSLLNKPCAKLVYISCNPHSLQEDLMRLSSHFELRSLRAFDMFPHTHHVEVVAELVRK